MYDVASRDMLHGHVVVYNKERERRMKRKEMEKIQKEWSAYDRKNKERGANKRRNRM